MATYYPGKQKQVIYLVYIVYYNHVHNTMTKFMTTILMNT